MRLPIMVQAAKQSERGLMPEEKLIAGYTLIPLARVGSVEVRPIRPIREMAQAAPQQRNR